MKTNKNLITWKDADQNLCTLAASILHAASVNLRSGRTAAGPVAMTNGDFAMPGYAEKTAAGGGPGRTIFSGVRDPDATVPGYGIPGQQIDEPDDREDETKDDNLNFNQPSSLCWWSFQNIIRFRLREAREELEKNLYPQKRRGSVNPNQSRNVKRERFKSKFGRQAER
jgi:hypothetical protein